MSESRVATPVLTPFPVSFQQFAATLRPQPIRDPQGRMVGLSAGGRDEIWLKHLGRLHGHEKHTFAEWQALIEQYGKEPAHT
jgi:hypothetical protein